MGSLHGEQLGDMVKLSCKGAEDAVITTSSGAAHTHTSHHDNEGVTDTTRFAGCFTPVTLSLSWCDVCAAPLDVVMTAYSAIRTFFNYWYPKS